jgi:hypothetical protein
MKSAQVINVISYALFRFAFFGRRFVRWTNAGSRSGFGLS